MTDTKFKKGQSGNPNGRPKKPLKDMPDLKTALAEILSQENDKGNNLIDAIITKLVKMSLDGNMQAIKELLDRGYGKAKETIESTVNNLTPSVYILPPQTDIKPYLNEADVIDETEQE